MSRNKNNKSKQEQPPADSRLDRLKQLKADVEAGHEHPSVSLGRLIDLMLDRGEEDKPVVPVEPVTEVEQNHGDSNTTV